MIEYIIIFLILIIIGNVILQNKDMFNQTTEDQRNCSILVVLVSGLMKKEYH